MHNLCQIYATTTNCAIHQKHQFKGTLADNYITYMNSVEMKQEFYFNRQTIFKVVGLVTWPLNESEARVDLVFIETSLLFLIMFMLFSC